MARRPDKLHERFRRALEEAPLHSTLGQWMAQQRAELEALFRGGEPDWSKMAEAFGKAGLRDEDDRRPTAETAKRTWRMVRERGRPSDAADRGGARRLAAHGGSKSPP
jgi:hypothetical protein